MTYRYAWGPRLKAWPASSPLRQLDRKGQECELIVRGAMNSCLVRFLSDDHLAVVRRNAIRRSVTVV